MSSPGGILTEPRRIAVVTTARSDYGILRPVIAGIQADPALDLVLVVGGAHLSAQFGTTETAIAADGFPIAERVHFLLSSDEPLAIAHSMGLATAGLADAFARRRPDLVMLLGDRWETLAAASAAAVLGVPVAHLHGGELTLGALDDGFRHAVTKLSHLHFAATHAYARRIRQLGEEDWRVVVSGAPGLDLIGCQERMDRAALSARLGRALADPFLLVTFHPVTTEIDRTETYVAELLAAIAESGVPALFTYAGADPGGTAINAAIEAYCAARPDSLVMPSLGSTAYFGAMALAAAMVGNSSSGIIEAASFGLPAVNIGRRQEGRVRGGNVIDCGHARAEIAAAVSRALSPHFRAGLGTDNPYYHGGATPIIVDTLKTVPLDRRLRVKRFSDHEGDGP